jgi:hypothetical protein
MSYLASRPVAVGHASGSCCTACSEGKACGLGADDVEKFVQENYKWLIPTVGIALYVYWERNTQAGREYARKTGGVQIVTIADLGKKRK